MPDDRREMPNTRPSAPAKRFPTDEDAPAPRRGGPEEPARREAGDRGGEHGDPSGEHGDRMPLGADEPGAGL
jgi:hypothetical protein